MPILTIQHQTVTVTPEDADKAFYRWVFLFIIAVIFLYVFCISLLKIPPENDKYVQVILGFLLGSGLGTLFGWRWGTSHSSAAKDAAIMGAIPIPPPIVENVNMPGPAKPADKKKDIEPGEILLPTGTVTGKGAE